MPAFWLALTLGFAVADWLAVEFFWRRVHFVAKPGALLSLICWFSAVVGWQGANLWFGLGLVFSLLGDINLMLPGRFFMPGLISFLLAHVFYIIGFNQGLFPVHPLVLLFLAAIVGYAVWLINLLISTPSGRRMAVPVGVYTAAISLMLFSALSCLLRPDWSLGGAAVVSLGAVLFLCSDSVLAYNRFVAKTAHHDLVVMATYHLAQITIVLGLTFH
jgi:alkylglycerol monooxygenase